MGGIYEVCVEMGSGAKIYMPNFINIGSAIQKLKMGVHIYIDCTVIA
jgi:hypothetical protein